MLWPMNRPVTECINLVCPFILYNRNFNHFWVLVNIVDYNENSIWARTAQTWGQNRCSLLRWRLPYDAKHFHFHVIINSFCFFGSLFKSFIMCTCPKYLPSIINNNNKRNEVIAPTFRKDPVRKDPEFKVTRSSMNNYHFQINMWFLLIEKRHEIQTLLDLVRAAHI